MNATTSECSSGCESGWTMYLDHLSNSTDPCCNVKNYQKGGEGANDVSYEDQEDEHLSMVSDASSGPPPRDYESSHYHYNGYTNPNSVSEGKTKSNKQKCKTKEPKVSKKQQNLCLDDTASSPFFDLSQVTPRERKNLATEFAGKKEAIK